MLKTETMAGHQFEISSVITTLSYFLIGTLVLISVIVYIILMSPILLYRICVTKFLSKLHPHIGKAVTVSGQFLAAEFLQSKKYPERPSRCGIMCRTVVQGIVSYEEISEAITTGWLTSKDSKLKYPEFQQYIQSWMGFMFWRKDNSFSLSNHVTLHSITGDVDIQSDIYMENIMNTPFEQSRSPWNAYLLHHNSSNVTVCIFRFHHAMVDGFSIMYAVCEGLFKQKLEDLELAKPKSASAPRVENSLTKSLLNYFIYTPLRVLYDSGYLAVMEQRSSKTDFPWYSPDKDKKWSQLYAKSSLIPVDKIKRIKNTIGGTFTGVILTCISAAATKDAGVRNISYKTKSLPVYTVVPVSCHPNKLRNNVMGTIVELEISDHLEAIGRLRTTERSFYDAKYKSKVPQLLSAFGALFSFPLARMSRQLCKNNMFPVLLTNFPGPSKSLYFKGKECISMDFGVGGEEGICGVTVSVVSYAGNVRITVNAEEGVMTRQQLWELIKSIENEINILSERIEDNCNITDNVIVTM